MKIIDRYILKTFLPPFFAAFFVVLFVLSMQVLWLYSDDIIGKGIGFMIVAEMMLYLCASMVPLSLPLAVLLSSIMSFGNLSENSELTAFKAAGVSLARIMRSLMVLILLLTVGTFYFSNNVVPYVNFKYENMLTNIINQKPALNITPGSFVQLGDYSIKVEKKESYDGGKTDEIVDVLLYDFSQRRGPTTIIVAERGIISSSDDKRYMILTLFNGHIYEETEPAGNSYTDRLRQPMSKVTFGKQVYPIDISSFLHGDLKQENSTDTWRMLNISQLEKQYDTLSTDYGKLFEEFGIDMKIRIRVTELNDSLILAGDRAVNTDTLRSIVNYIPQEKQRHFNRLRIERLKGQLGYLNDNLQRLRDTSSHLNRFPMEIHRKYAIAFCVIVMFFVGAPLGALIRKGGMGLPMVAAVMIYVVYHILSLSSERMGIDGTLDSFNARWLPNLVLLPFGIWLTYRATRDLNIVNLDPVLKIYDKYAAKIKQGRDERKKTKRGS